MKKVISILLVIIMLCSSFTGLLITSHASLSTIGKCGDNIEYRFYADSGVLLISGTGEMYTGLRYYSPFRDNNQIKTIFIRDGVESIGFAMFSGCSNLITIEIPFSVTEIASSAFSGCEKLSTVNYISDSVGYWENIRISNAGNNILINATINCLSAPTDISNYLCDISSGKLSETISFEFDDDTGLLSIYGSGNIPDNVGNSYFETLGNIVQVEIGEGITRIGNWVFASLMNLYSISIPTTVTSIGEYAFYGCNELTSVNLPNSLKIIEANAFINSGVYTKQENWRGNLLIQSDCVLASRENIEGTVEIPNGMRLIASDAFLNRTAITDVILPNSIHYINNSVFENCSNLSNISISTTLLEIGDKSFYNCPCLLSVSFPDSLTTIGESAFERCSALKNIHIGNNVSSLPLKVFQGNTSLKNVTIGNSVSRIVTLAFAGCVNLKNLTLPASVEIQSESFSSCSGIENITISPGSGVMKTYDVTTYVNTPWYISRNSLKNITLEEGITNVPAYAFYQTKVEQIIIPSTVTKLGNMAFAGATNLNDISILNDCCEIYDAATTLPEYTVIHANPNSTAQDYAQEYSRTFECLEHTLETQAAKDPTCTETGLTEGSHCTVCGKVLSVQETIDALGHDYGNGIVTKEPTCILNGEKTFTCSRCGDTYTETIDALGHTYDSGIITRPATCSQKGEREYTCVVCGDKYTEEIAMTEHTPEIDSAVAATCEKAGLTEGSHCSVCGKVLIAQEVVNATGHSFNFTITTPTTCTTKGIRTYICSICGDSYNEEIDMISHMPAIDAAVAATCTKTGLTEGSHCSVCGKVLTAQKVINATGHSYVKEVTAPTCKYGGYTTYTCSVCGDSYKADYTEVTTNHNYKSTVTTPATCTKEGVRTFTCSICGDMYTTAISMTSHKSVTDKAVTPTCTKVGLTIGSHCSVCGAVLEEQQVIPATGHTYTTEVTAPTCKTKGYTTHTCSVCGDSFKDSYVDKTDEHSFNAVITKQATCTKTGVKTFTCSVCGYYYTETLPLIEHTEVTDEAVAPTCTKTGLSQGTHCDVCGKVLQEQVVIPASGHSVETIPAKAVSCTESGQTEGQYCTVCGEVLKEQIELPALGHSWSSWQIMTAPTCEKTGLSMRMCNNCSQIDKLTIPALEHSFSMQTVTATCTHAGYTTYTCDDCGYSYIGDFVPMAEHTYIDTVIEPTTESQGYTVHTCKDCGYSYVDSITDILPSQMHYIIPSLADISTTITIKSDENEYAVTAENGVFELDNIKGDVYRVYAKQKNSLTVCIGEYDTKSGEVVYADVVEMPLGDVNGDSVIDIADLSVLLAKGNYGEENTDIDLTGDGTITIDDIAVALQTNSYGKKSVNIV